jgi:hypothetical protein
MVHSSVRQDVQHRLHLCINTVLSHSTSTISNACHRTMPRPARRMGTSATDVASSAPWWSPLGVLIFLGTVCKSSVASYLHPSTTGVSRGPFSLSSKCAGRPPQVERDFSQQVAEDAAVCALVAQLGELVAQHRVHRAPDLAVGRQAVLLVVHTRVDLHLPLLELEACGLGGGFRTEPRPRSAASDARPLNEKSFGQSERAKTGQLQHKKVNFRDVGRVGVFARKVYDHAALEL